MEMNEIFSDYQNIAVYGMSTNISKPSHTVPGYMIKQGYNVFPIHPAADRIAKQKAYKSLMEIPEEINILNVFRPSEECLDVVKEAIERKKLKGDIKLIWLQLGIVNNEAKELAEENGIKFIQDKCMYVEHKNHAA